MALLLNIDSAFNECSVAISNNEEVIAQEKSIVQKDHASFLQLAIKKICAKTNIDLRELDAIAVANGPGSYTGLRVGLASAKGICYALNKPLILLNTLDLLASAMRQHTSGTNNTLYCPMIDARRMEVFTSLYNFKLELIKDYSSVAVNDHFLQQEKINHTIVVGGNGSLKLRNVSNVNDFEFSIINYNMQQFVKSALNEFKRQHYFDLAYSEPFYFKQVYFK